MVPTTSGADIFPWAKGLMSNERGIIRQIAMDLLYGVGGQSGTEIGEMMVVGYGTVGLGRKRLREKLKRDKHFLGLSKELKQICKQ